MNNSEFVTKYSGVPISEEYLAHLASMKCTDTIGALAKVYLAAGQDFLSEIDKHSYQLG